MRQVNLPLTTNTFEQCQRKENDLYIQWSGSRGNIWYTFIKSKNEWLYHGTHIVSPTCELENRFQLSQKPPEATKAPTPPQLRLVSRGQSTITGKEVIEIHAYNQSREVWEKLPINANIVSGCYWTLEEILNR